ncbi:MAG: hypothetical protein IT385_03125 [Deltaproteobacteria bacterium]|nr:hypothetical protein [Deltaproteobacteria bacterium]
MITRAAVALTFVLCGPLARADVPPEDGLKYVGNTFRVTGLAAFPDHVVVAYPWSASNGAPTHEHVVMRDGDPVSIGRRSPNIVLWAVRHDAWEAFAKTLVKDEDRDAAALEAFLRAPNAVRCDARPVPIGTIDEDDPRDVIDHPLIVRSITDAACSLEAPAPPAAKPSSCGACSGGDAVGLAWLGALFALTRARRRRG